MAIDLRLGRVSIYLSLRVMPDPCRPAMIHRSDSGALLIIDPRGDRTEILLWTLDNLTVPEQNAYRAAFDCGPVGEPIPDLFTEPVAALLYVPPAIRLPGEDALQGGSVLAQRLADGEMDLELALWQAEVAGRERADIYTTA